MTSDFYVYLHRRASDGSVFYVGKGSRKRAWERSSRNAHWRNIVAKHGLVVELAATGLQEWYALELESEMIFRLGRQTLCNLTDGGDGISGHVHSDETRARLRELNTGKTLAPEARRKISEALAGRPRDEATRLKIGETQKGTRKSPEHRAKLSAANAGKTQSESAREKRRAALKGRVFSDQHRKKIEAAKAGKSICCSNGMVFEKKSHAARWLRANGHPKAERCALTRAAERRRPAYGFNWFYPQSTNI